jgi:hypothetical protein
MNFKKIDKKVETASFGTRQVYTDTKREQYIKIGVGQEAGFYKLNPKKKSDYKEVKVK